jgi:hypothetical protein
VTFDPYAALRADPAITVVWDVTMPERGRWYQRLRTVLVRGGLTQAERRTVVTHELIHAERGDETTCPKTERRVDHEAARRLIDLDDLADTLRWALGPEEVADELHVTPDTVMARLSTLTPAEKQYIEQRLAARDHVA